ncbi:glyoxalase [Cellulomonas gelida]|uniref:Glyoxalase n=2 Tax=Cellulomonas gelida TaxID=1712 RepID=A0A4Y3KJS4_9CELL|nr:glyoxalase [Cellulomonas gelida]GGL19688.1 glyoxalase [Cellulomonas gelida]
MPGAGAGGAGVGGLVQGGRMEISFVAGFGPITRDADAARTFWSEGGLGIPLEEPAPGYLTNDTLQGVKAFALWPLAQAAESTFGTPQWPESHPVPQAWLELDVATHEAVAEAAAELVGLGHRLLREAHLEPWGQTTARLQSPEGLLVGISHTPWMHVDGAEDAAAEEYTGHA